MSIVEMFKTCASIQIFEGDGFPSQLCSNCVNQILQSYAFRQQCEKSDITLHNNKYKNVRNNSRVLEDIAAAGDENSITIKEEITCEDQTVENNYSPILEGTALDYENSMTVKNKICKNKAVKKRSDKCYQNIENKNSSSFQCKKCGNIFESNIILRDHIKKTHPYKKKEKKCPVCSKSIIGFRLVDHMRSHTKEKPFICDICNHAFSLNENLRRHKLIHTGERPHKCPICNKAFSQNYKLSAHITVHSNEKPFQCTICLKKFRLKHQLGIHIKRHQNDNDNQNNVVRKDHKFLCSECGKGFCYLYNLTIHSDTFHAGKKSYSCPDCGKSFALKGQLKAHSTIHSGIKSYQCTVCNKSFRHQGTLKTHSFLHTGEKPFSCTLCERAFTQGHHLVYHMRTHSGEKPYECSFCGKRFSLKINMIVHTRTHTGETPFHCPVCGKGFYDSSSMKKHKKTHGNNTDVIKINETTLHNESNTE